MIADIYVYAFAHVLCIYFLFVFIEYKLYCIHLISVRNHKGVIRKSEVKVKQEKQKGDFRLGTIRDY